ncbi:hypothetical protein [Heyndrickxia coagulans]|uniref:hypothetical protein n=1 Tax=Heyndrickxia coagulans TaxID=1398 RepID=UPI002E1DA1E1|nr:hypothetical protein [Heyndrickxia coagulans]
MGFWVMLFCFIIGIVLLVNSFKYRKNKAARFGIELVIGLIFFGNGNISGTTEMRMPGDTMKKLRYYN